MGHEFVKGDRHCVGCGGSAKEIARAEACPADPNEAPKPEPQVWHLNVWTNVNGVAWVEHWDGPEPEDLHTLLVEKVCLAVDHIREASKPAEG